MHDGKKIILGLLIFLGLATFPAWYLVAHGGHGDVPELAKPVSGDRCVESKDFMRAHHMQLLDGWRDAVVREGRRTYTSRDFPGRSYEMSLTKTCLRRRPGEVLRSLPRHVERRAFLLGVSRCSEDGRGQLTKR